MRCLTPDADKFIVISRLNLDSRPSTVCYVMLCYIESLTLIQHRCCGGSVFWYSNKMIARRLSHAVVDCGFFEPGKHGPRLWTKQRQRWPLLAPTAPRNMQTFSSTRPATGPSAANQAVPALC